MNWAAVARRLSMLAVVSWLAGASALASRPGVRADRSHPASSPLATAAPDSPFRLGTAGQPFVWSSAIGDFNDDGRPDYAIADKIGRRESGFRYAIELTVAGGDSQSVDFDSAQDALAVTLSDVDEDRDLDVVVTAVVSQEVVGVWLNDGTGHFHRASAEPLPRPAGPVPVFGSPSRCECSVGESVPRGHAHAAALDSARRGVAVPAVRVTSAAPLPAGRTSLSAASPRAPPPFSRSL